MMFLLDVNALLAMRYEHHVHYARVDKWASQLRTECGQEHVVFAWAHLMRGSRESSHGILIRQHEYFE